jgi:hypothetical protein
VDDSKSKASAVDLMSVHTVTTTKSRPQTATMMKRKILDRLNQLEEKQLAQLEEELDSVRGDDIKLYANGSITNEDKASIITQDRLKKFNEIYGFENGPATRIEENFEDGEEDQELGAEDQSNPNEGYEE